MTCFLHCETQRHVIGFLGAEVQTLTTAEPVSHFGAAGLPSAASTKKATTGPGEK